MSILLLPCVCIAALGVGLGSHPVTSLGCKSYCSRLCQNPSGAMYILVRNRLQTGGRTGRGVAILAQNVQQGAACSSPKGSDSDCKEKTLAGLPPSPLRPIRGEHKAKFCLSQKYENVLLSEIFFCRWPQGHDGVGGQCASEVDCSHGPRNVG